MAIIKQAKNIRITVRGNYTAYFGTLIKTAEKLNVEATKGNLTLNSNKKIVANSNSKNN